MQYVANGVCALLPLVSGLAFVVLKRFATVPFILIGLRLYILQSIFVFVVIGVESDVSIGGFYGEWLVRW